ncbi:nucleotide pyrophosphohydrolase [Halogeometricum borinquense DSM 11551]|uniref:Nucleotide pyrophosphohydrolase n=1 Tax=Halogeometricum borinquense (strain ATCC 700274 / DSM 11551 / JCM 10706 / KCTC 4070 / PR3) TaxID=469382 RepID=E4NPL8_HALBP|nr:MazG-like family protein [Halogeometricum borinquense]ADQ67688.1 MazG nucleotide pyrophosphohydrolase family protein [Halogeometricum borinquense DSM 11551]ELY23631.1 nucleotide pyrophosphohydrolase [Halogeometricum borinquense DSM 11551]
MTDEQQQRVAAFLDAHELHAPPAYRLLDLAAEVGELAADAAKSSEYGASPDKLDVKRDELGDALFCLYALADELDVDAAAALDESVAKYEARIDDAGAPGSDAKE